ncbi:MAG: hypothetical protein JOZ05_20255 [Acetobacteraceae bacterium]|nr:hypothetical protein [Acetobacteraceae bacterium]
MSWSYGAGNGDPIQYPGAAPVYSRSYGMGADVPVSTGQKPAVQYGYGADNESGVTVQTQPAAPAPQRLAAPATAPAAGQLTSPAPGTHS